MFDFSAVTIQLKKRSTNIIPTGLAVQVPAGTYGRIAPRSGLATKHSIDVGGNNSV